MKKGIFFYSLFAAMTLAGCSSSDDVADGSSNAEISDGTPRYMTVNIVSAGATNTSRAQAGTPTGASYENGTADENKITHVRFYFFGDDGNAAAVKSNGTSYFDWQSTTAGAELPTGTTGANETPNVEKTIQATVVINTKEGDRIPTKMIAIANDDKIPTTDGTTNFYDRTKNYSLNELRNLTSDFASLANDNKFIMASSVYADVAGERVSTSTIASTNMKTTETEALANPVECYIERNVGKVTVQYASDLSVKEFTVDNVTYKGVKLVEEASNDGKGNVTYQDLKVKVLEPGDGNNTTWTENEKTVYMKLLKWNLTATTPKAYLSKHINPGWRTNLFDNSVPWNWSENHRSYWATNVLTEFSASGSDENGASYESFMDLEGGTDSKGNTITANGKEIVDSNAETVPCVYTNENAAANYETGLQRTYPTQALIIGHLCTEDGKTLELAEFAGKYYAGETNVMNAMLATMSGLNLYKVTGTKEESDGSKTTTYSGPTAEDLKFVTATTNGSADAKQGGKSRYFVELALGDGKYDDSNSKYINGKNETWYKLENSKYIQLTDEEIAAELKKAGHAKIWKDGMTYFYYKIKHLATKDVGEWGIVRNHFYQCTLNKVIGLGTPVYQADEEIYPETPIDQDTYIAAQIKVLSWRVVPNAVDLGQTGTVQ